MNCIRSTKPQSDNAWLFDICKLYDAVAVSTSTNKIISYDCETLAVRQTISKAHDDVITGLVSPSNTNTFFSCSRDGTAKCWDSRTSKAVRTFRARAGVLSMAHHGTSDRLAVGTELKGSDAVVSVFDMKSQEAVLNYVDSHAEDVTSLSWHPSNDFLLSGGGDGIINLFDTAVVDEEDAVLQVFNHGSSLHIAQFVGKNEIIALSHMETASLYSLSYNHEDVSRDEVKEYGDVRSTLAMDYAISFVSSPQPILFTGSSSGHISVIPFDVSNMRFEPQNRLDMESGTEVIRSVYLDNSPDSPVGPILYATSEDGILRVFSKQTLVDDETRIARKRERRESKSARKKDALRFEPY